MIDIEFFKPKPQQTYRVGFRNTKGEIGAFDVIVDQGEWKNALAMVKKQRGVTVAMVRIK